MQRYCIFCLEEHIDISSNAINSHHTKYGCWYDSSYTVNGSSVRKASEKRILNSQFYWVTHAPNSDVKRAYERYRTLYKNLMTLLV